MPMPLKQILSEAQILPYESKAILAEKVVASIEEKIDPQITKIHLAEVIRRRDEIRSGKVRKTYMYIAEGIEMGKRPDLTSGGLIRSSGGWSVIKSAHKANIHIKSDERILGDSDFVAEILKAADESLHHRFALKV